MTNFKAGQTYGAKSICDSNCIFKFKVIRRTAKSIWIVGGQIKDITRKAITVIDGRETVKPLGSYSMAPILRA
jgi:hypothetical protein